MCDLGLLFFPHTMTLSKFTGEVACICYSCITLLYMVVGPCSIHSLANEHLLLFLGCYEYAPANIHQQALFGHLCYVST